MVTTKKYHHGDLRNALLEAALEILGEVGPSGISLRGIAKKVGVSQTAPYSHFSDKNALLIDVAASGFEKLSQALEASRESKPTALRSELNGLGIAYVNFAMNHKALFRLMFGDDLSDLPKSELYEQEAIRAYTILKNCIERSGGSLTQTRAAWSVVHGMATLIVDNKLILKGDMETELKKILECLSL